MQQLTIKLRNQCATINAIIHHN